MKGSEFLVTVNNDLIKVRKMKDGKWKFTKINKVAEFSHFKELQQYVKHIDNELIEKNNG